jgi:hypothetical protein
MKRKISISVLSLLCLGIGFIVGWWANSPGLDILCSRPFVYKLGKDIKGEGILIGAGRQINLRSCEYANRFSVELYYDKGIHPEVFVPVNSAPNIGNHGAEQYSVEAK